MRDEDARDALEADFQQYYNLDLFKEVDLSNGVYRPTSQMSLRRVANLTSSLPTDSRIIKLVRNDPFDHRDHLLANIIDLLTRVDYWTNVVARGTVDEASIFDNVPEPMKRPKIKEEPEPEAEKEEIQFMTGRELAANLGDGAVTVKKIKKAARAQIETHRDNSEA